MMETEFKDPRTLAITELQLAVAALNDQVAAHREQIATLEREVEHMRRVLGLLPPAMRQEV